MSKHKIHPKGYPSICYKPPNGIEVPITVRNITPEAVEYFTSVNAKLSTEDTSLGYVLYADVSEFMGESEDDIPCEAINIVTTNACPFESYDDLANMCRELVDRSECRS